MSLTLPQILESLMMITFGASWPMQIIKTVRVKNPMGKSFIFMYLILFGYVCGIIGKLVPGAGSVKPVVLALYIINFLMVGTDLVLSHYYIYRLKHQNNQ